MKDQAKVEVMPAEMSSDELDDNFESAVKHHDCLVGQMYWTVPMDLKPGQYYIEIGSDVLGQCARTETFNVTEAFGVEDNTAIG